MRTRSTSTTVRLIDVGSFVVFGQQKSSLRQRKKIWQTHTIPVGRINSLIWTFMEFVDDNKNITSVMFLEKDDP